MKIFFVTLAAALLFFLCPAHARVSSLVVKVNGMACPFCAFGVEKRMQHVSGVESVAVDIQAGTARATAGTDASIKYQDVPQAVKEAGFTSGDIRITAEGRMENATGNGLILQMKDRFIPVTVGDDDLKKQLTAVAGTGREVVLKGRIVPQKGGKWTLYPEIMELPEP